YDDNSDQKCDRQPAAFFCGHQVGNPPVFLLLSISLVVIPSNARDLLFRRLKEKTDSLGQTAPFGMTMTSLIAARKAGTAAHRALFDLKYSLKQTQNECIFSKREIFSLAAPTDPFDQRKRQASLLHTFLNSGNIIRNAP